MTDTALGAAVTRLERAIMRLERSGARAPETDDTLAALQARHLRLRARVAEATARLDLLLGDEDGAA